MSTLSLSTGTYEPSPIKRERATAAAMNDRRQHLYRIVKAQQPMTVRQVFYQATVRGLIEKTENGYRKVQGMLTDMRKSGALPYGWIADNTRLMRKPRTYVGIEHALENTAKFYRKNLWADAGVYVEVWLEKDALSGVIYDVTHDFDVPLMVARGYASLSFLHSAAEELKHQDRPCFIYHLGDFDPSGVNAAETIERTLRELAPGADITFERLAVKPYQIEAWNLPSRPTKQTDTRAKNWKGGNSVELDAIEPDILRAIVRTAIERHLPPREFERLKQIEAAERDTLLKFVSGWEGAGDDA